MSLTVGRLYSGESFLGSAWMVTPDTALTAYHCVFDESGQQINELNIEFSGVQGNVIVEHKNFNSDFDVALLRVTSSHDLASIVIPFSRKKIKTDDSTLAYGHSDAFKEEFEVYSLPLNVVNPDFVLVGGIKKIDLSYPGGAIPNEEGGSILGMSGGPLVLRDEQEYAIGVLTDAHIEAQRVHASSLVSLANVFSELQEVLLLSPYVDTNSNVLVIDRADDGQIIWSCLEPPENADNLTLSNSQINEVICFADLSRLGEAAFALKRLFWHGDFREVKCRNSIIEFEKLRSIHRKLEELPSSLPSWLEPPSTFTAENYPGPLTLMTEEDFCQRITNALNAGMLNRLNLEIEECDSNELRKTELIGVAPESSLWDGMLNVWSDWKQTLEQSEELNNQYLAHCLFTSASIKFSMKDLLCLGRKTSISRLLKPTIFALALAASNVSIKPDCSCLGNFEVGGQRGHATGIERFKSGNILDAANHAWKTNTVILPYLQMPFLDLWKHREPMNRNVLSGPRLNDPGIPPLVISGDPGWMRALRGGESMVRSYYQEKFDIIQELKDGLAVGPRDGGMEHAS
jgi:hypothetical protein